MQDSEANEFYNRLVDGKDYVEHVTLEHGSGAKLENVEMRPVGKQKLGYVVRKLPEDLFGAVEEADSPDEAEELLEESDAEASLSAMSEDTIEAFEELVSASLSHSELTNTQMEEVVEALDFGVLFELGGQVIDMSFAQSGAIKDFHEQG